MGAGWKQVLQHGFGFLKCRWMPWFSVIAPSRLHRIGADAFRKANVIARVLAGNGNAFGEIEQHPGGSRDQVLERDNRQSTATQLDPNTLERTGDKVHIVQHARGGVSSPRRVVWISNAWPPVSAQSPVAWPRSLSKTRTARQVLAADKQGRIERVTSVNIARTVEAARSRRIIVDSYSKLDRS